MTPTVYLLSHSRSKFPEIDIVKSTAAKGTTN